MKAITNSETRNKLLEQLKNAVCIQLALWWTCFAIEALLDDKCDAITRINQVGRNYAETEIRDFQVEEIMFGGEAETLARTTGGQEKVRVLTQLTKDSRRKLLHATQNAVWLHSAFLNEAESISELRNCDLNIVLDFLSVLSAEACDHPEIPEIHQTWFFGEVHSNRETSEV
jgi:hypothetical protein